MSVKTIFEQAVDVFGPQDRQTLLAEEVGELLAALNQWARGRIPASRVAEEVADVTIVLEQLPYVIAMNGMDPEKFSLMVGRFREQKLVRLQGILKQEAKAHE